MSAQEETAATTDCAHIGFDNPSSPSDLSIIHPLVGSHALLSSAVVSEAFATAVTNLCLNTQDMDLLARCGSGGVIPAVLGLLHSYGASSMKVAREGYVSPFRLMIHPSDSYLGFDFLSRALLHNSLHCVSARHVYSDEDHSFPM